MMNSNINIQMHVVPENIHAYPPSGGGDTRSNGLYGDPLPKKGTFCRMQVFKRVGFSQAKV